MAVPAAGCRRGVRCPAGSSQLAPISFTNGLDGPRRRQAVRAGFVGPEQLRLDQRQPAGRFPATAGILDGQCGIHHAERPGTDPNINFTYNVNAAGVYNADNPALTPVFNPTIAVPSPTPGLAQRDKKINLNYPLPVSNDPNEPVRQKWINDTYQLLKSVLPPKAVDTPEELAQLSQYVINIVDFRDPDSTMTHWVNPDVHARGDSHSDRRGRPRPPCCPCRPR